MPKQPAGTILLSADKLAALAASGTLNCDLQAVRDPLFYGGGFFDPRDLLQVRYEMSRRHRVENLSVAATAKLFGVSLPTAYQAHAAFAAAGLAGLLPKRRGPKQGHKLTPEILAHIEQRRRERPDWRARDAQTELQERFSLNVHRRSLEWASRGKKVVAPVTQARNQRDAADYETLRSEALLIGVRQAGTQLPFGLAGWLTDPTPPRRLPSTAAQSAATSRSGSLPAAFASIVWRLTQEAAHA